MLTFLERVECALQIFCINRRGQILHHFHFFKDPSLSHAIFSFTKSPNQRLCALWNFDFTIQNVTSFDTWPVIHSFVFVKSVEEHLSRHLDAGIKSTGIHIGENGCHFVRKLQSASNRCTKRS